jgi:toxin ParE1/3/4
MKVVFSVNAGKDLLETVRFIARDKPAAARQWAEAVKESVMKLADFPRSGRITAEYSDETLREIIHGRYRIVYKIDEKKDTVLIVAVHHSRRI